MKLTDIFRNDLKVFETILLEDFGNLKKLDPNFLKMVAPGFKKGAFRHYGKESKVDILPARSAREAYQDLFKTDEERKPEDAIGIILRSGADQVLMVLGMPNGNYKMFLNGPVYASLDTDIERKNKVSRDFTDEYTRRYERYSKLDKYVEIEEKASIAKRTINNVYAALKDSGTIISVLAVYPDASRAKKRQERGIRGKAQPRWVEPKDAYDKQRYKRDAKDALMKRLEKFKANRAKQYKSVDEFLNDLISSGYVEKINVGGFIYDLSPGHILSVPHLLKKGNSNSGTYIEYRLDQKHSPKYAEIRNTVNAAEQKVRQAQTEEEKIQAQAEYEQVKQQMGTILPYQTIQVQFGLLGGAIVPKAVNGKDKLTYF